LSVRVIVSELAELDVLATVEFMAARSPQAGSNFYRGLDASFALLAEQPGMGRVCEFRQPRLRAVRWWPVKGFESHLIVYDAEPGAIRILRVLHGSRDLDAELRRSVIE
jgi:plasmid stabilization system protein ParE